MAFDYIIVGAGSAGCILANRLTEDGRSNVLVLEAGPNDNHPFVHMPMGIGKIMANPDFMWLIPTEAQPDKGLLQETWYRGRIVGGSSSTNGMMYFRGHPNDYEEWVRRGAAGWGWSTIKRSFEAIENMNGKGTGPLGISIKRNNSKINRAFIDAGKQLGIPEVDNLNHDEQEGVGFVTQTTLKGKRSSSAVAFLTPQVRARKNLTIETGVLVDKVIFDGIRAVGVAAYKDGKPVEYRAEREVILSAGGLVSPLILQRSGIGNAEYLKSLDVPVVYDSPRVGENLLEHRALMMKYKLKGPWSNNNQYSGWRLMKNVIKYYLTGGGVMGGVPYQVGANVKTDPAMTQPDVQITMSPSSSQIQANGKVGLDPFPGMNIFGFPMRSTSQGSIKIRSKDPKEYGIINSNILSDDYDKQVTIAMFKLIRKWVTMPALAALVQDEIWPGLDKLNTDEEILDAFRKFGTVTYHACGTTAMGDGDAPLDEKLRVRGVSGLRVIDGGSMPMMPSANTNGPIMAMAWRAAELVLEGRNS